MLAPYALFVLVVAFSGDYDPWPTAGWGGLYLVTAVCTTMVLLLRKQGRALLILAGICSTLQAALLVRGMIELLDKPDMMSWLDHGMLSAPIVLVPLVSLAAMVLRDRRWPLPQCPHCGYDRTGLGAQRCPECGK